MKQFNLQEYLANPSRQVVTRDGRKVRIICTDRKGDTPIIALVYNANEGLEYSYSFYSDGKFFRNRDEKSDLFFAPEKHEGWINIYGNSIYYPGTKMYNTEQEAKEMRGTGAYVATVKIEWEEE